MTSSPRIPMVGADDVSFRKRLTATMSRGEGGNDENDDRECYIPRVPEILPDLAGVGDERMEDENGDGDRGVEMHPEDDR